MKFKCLLLDLDGTLLNTAPDMVGALNRLLAEENKSEVDYEPASKLVSQGAIALVKHGFNLDDANEAEIQRLRQRFLDIYADNVCLETHLYENMMETLDWCEAHHILWGVVTNKPAYLAKPILEKLNLIDRCAILVGGDTLPVNKPHPAPLLHCTTMLFLAPSECLYVGDDERDIQAGRAAGMDTAVAMWGYIENGLNPEDWQPDYLCQKPAGLLKLIKEKAIH